MNFRASKRRMIGVRIVVELDGVQHQITREGAEQLYKELGRELNFKLNQRPVGVPEVKQREITNKGNQLLYFDGSPNE